MTLLQTRPHCPTEQVQYTRDWIDVLGRQAIHINPQGPLFNFAVRDFRMFINDQSFVDLFRLQNSEQCNPVYAASGSQNIDSYYYSLADSIDMILTLLAFQFDCNLRFVVNFLKDVLMIFDKQHGKINTMLITGPASSGKNVFCDPLCDFSLNPGKLESPSRMNNFPYESGHNRRVNKWDEAVLDVAFHDSILNLMQGKGFSINIKHQASKILNKTPLFVLANFNPFPNEERFIQRYIHYEWRYCPFLKEWNSKQPYPMAMGLLVMWANRLDMETMSSAYDRVYSDWRRICKKIQNVD